MEKLQSHKFREKRSFCWEKWGGPEGRGNLDYLGTGEEGKGEEERETLKWEGKENGEGEVFKAKDRE